MKKNIVFVLALLCTGLLFACGEKHYNEWVTKNGKQYYYDEKGIMLKNCYSKIGSDTYVFNKEGAVIKDCIVNLDGKASYVDTKGKLKQEGWFSLDGYYYFVDQSVLQTGWVKYLGDWYYLDQDYHYMLTDQWIENKYYVDSSGKMLLNTTKEIYGKYYIFDSNGIAREKPEFELIVADYPNPLWAYDGLVRINKLNISVKDFYSYVTEAALEIEIDVTPVRLEYRNTNCLDIYYRIYDEEGYEIEDSFFRIDDDVRSLQTIKRKLNKTVKAAKNKTYKMVIYSNKTPF